MFPGEKKRGGGNLRKIPDRLAVGSGTWLNTEWGRQAFEDEGISQELQHLASSALVGSDEAVAKLLASHKVKKQQPEVQAQAKTKKQQPEVQTQAKAETNKPKQEPKVEAPAKPTKSEAVAAFRKGLMKLTPSNAGRQSENYTSILQAVGQLEMLAKKETLTPEEDDKLITSIITIQSSFGALYCKNKDLRDVISLHDFVTKSEEMFQKLTEGMERKLDLSKFKETVLKPILQLRDFKSLIVYKSSASKAATYDFLSEIESEDKNFNASLNRTKKAFDVKDSLKIFKLMKSDPERFLYILHNPPADQAVKPSDTEIESVAKMIELYASDESKELIKTMSKKLGNGEIYNERHYSFIAAIISFCRFITFNSDARLAQNIEDAFKEVVHLTDLYPERVEKVEAIKYTKALLGQRQEATTNIERE
jgi:hypothetical protein